MRPYVVWTPPYDRRSGGIMVMHRLCHELNERGQEAYINVDQVNTKWNTPYYGKTALENPIVVYPEITHGNPLGYQTVVRYILNNIGKLSGPTAYPPTDILFAFSHMFNDWGAPEERIMFLPVIDTEVYKDTGQHRDKALYYIGKGSRRYFIDETFDAIAIDNQTGADPQNLSHLLQTATVLYCYDNITAMTELARLCGCPVVLVPNGEYSEEKYQEHEMGMEGLGWNKMPEPFDSSKFMERYKALKETFYSKLDTFIEVTQKG